MRRVNFLLAAKRDGNCWELEFCSRVQREHFQQKCLFFSYIDIGTAVRTLACFYDQNSFPEMNFSELVSAPDQSPGAANTPQVTDRVFEHWFPTIYPVFNFYLLVHSFTQKIYLNVMMFTIFIELLRLSNLLLQLLLHTNSSQQCSLAPILESFIVILPYVGLQIN